MKRILSWILMLTTILGLASCAGGGQILGLASCAGGGQNGGVTEPPVTEPPIEPLGVADLSVEYDAGTTPNSVREIVRLFCEAALAEWEVEIPVNPSAATRCRIVVSQSDALGLNAYAVKATEAEGGAVITAQGDNPRSTAYAVQQLRLLVEEKEFSDLLAVDISGDLGIDMPKKISIYGDSISTYYNISDSALYNNTLPQNVTYYNVERMTRNEMLMTKDETWWGIVLSTLNAKLCVNNSYMGDTTYSQYALGRAENLHKNFMNKIENPDTIIVYFGINDYNGGRPQAEFKTNYGNLVAKMHETYPDARIYCCTLMPTYVEKDKGTDVEVYNDAIREVCEEKDAVLIDLYAMIGEDYRTNLYTYTIEGCHPYKSGMKAMGDAIAQAIKDWVNGVEA